MSTESKPQSDGILRKLGLYGLDRIEDAVLAGLVTGDPVLLIGSHGCAKTLLARRLADALGLKFWAYDASKAMFEDVIGFPDPTSLGKGTVKYVSTPISLWDKEFILIDEISRATPSMQNKWLEVVRSRTVMGKRAKALRYIFAAMNPPTYAGAYPLDAALAGRFAFIVCFPEAAHMSIEDIEPIISNITEDDAPALRMVSCETRTRDTVRVQRLQGQCSTISSASRETARTTPLIEPHCVSTTGSKALCEILKKAREQFFRIKHEYGGIIKEYLSVLFTNLKTSGVLLDGRRLGMLWRNAIAYLSVICAKKGEMSFSPSSVATPLLEAMRFSLPFEAEGKSLPAILLRNAHNSAMLAIEAPEKRPERNRRMRLLTASDIVEFTIRYRDVATELSELDHHDIVESIQESIAAAVSREDGAAEFARALWKLRNLISCWQHGEIAVPPNPMAIAMAAYRKLSALTGSASSGELAAAVMNELRSRRYDLSNPLVDLALRLALHLHASRISGSRLRRQIETVLPKAVSSFNTILGEFQEIETRLQEKLS